MLVYNGVKVKVKGSNLFDADEIAEVMLTARTNCIVRKLDGDKWETCDFNQLTVIDGDKSYPHPNPPEGE